MSEVFDTIALPARLLFGSCGLALIIGILLLVHKNKLKEKYTLLWLPLGGGFLLVSLVPEFVLAIGFWTGLHYLTVVLLGTILVFTAMLLYLTVRLSGLREDLKTIAQEIALMKTSRPVENQLPDFPKKKFNPVVANNIVKPVLEIKESWVPTTQRHVSNPQPPPEKS
jgi:hypothetical protein